MVKDLEFFWILGVNIDSSPLLLSSVIPSLGTSAIHAEVAAWMTHLICFTVQAREYDVLLHGDAPWKTFLNNAWYIKILSPEDVHNLGKQGAECSSSNGGQRLSSSCDS
ncbi:hypothetical protein AQUCO_00200782v1 [Aquilegia coerulea]|uniref:Uncharacterized protein n=1 Tax=Aquilegia coerulea TaxID=218851 RepID=A0A2G5F4R4_AQUCA|nr:hypothetical protein AQUCO_00200782v1 [Aquilegia coerulea]